MTKEFEKGLVWFRRDLRIFDNAALAEAISRCTEVWCVFVFDLAILNALPKRDRRIEFIRGCLLELNDSLEKLSGRSNVGLIVLHAHAQAAIPALADELQVNAVFAARDYEPYARHRDDSVRASLQESGKSFFLLKDHVIFEERELLTQSAKPYSVFTPYMRKWLSRLGAQPLTSVGHQGDWSTLVDRPVAFCHEVPSLEVLGFETTNLQSLNLLPGETGAAVALQEFKKRIDRYDETRNFPSIKGPSYLGIHLRFGTVSIREVVFLSLNLKKLGNLGATTWLNELIWRDFYFQILANHPQVATHSFKPEYDTITWETGEIAKQRFSAWCNGRTGYPIVDAAMSQLNLTGYMHNRLRMIAGSFLVKHLGIDWRWGEKYFAEHLNDFDMAANNGGWQWVSSSGCDAQPYFRIFNPMSQSEKFDSAGKFIRRYIPELMRLDDKTIHAPWLAGKLELESAGVFLGQNYPLPIVDHPAARADTLARYGKIRKPD
jgi:deoxyribodipyrimidine photo-lyase